MRKSATIEIDIHFHNRGRGNRRALRTRPIPSRPVPEPGRAPPIARPLALAIRFEQLLRSGQIADYTELAELGHVSRARITQIMNLLLLAPDLQEEILFLPRTERGRDAIHLRQLQPLALVADWR